MLHTVLYFDIPTTLQVFRKMPRVDPVAAGIDWKFMYTRVRKRAPNTRLFWDVQQ